MERGVAVCCLSSGIPGAASHLQWMGDSTMVRRTQDALLSPDSLVQVVGNIISFIKNSVTCQVDAWGIVSRGGDWNPWGSISVDG
jgi:hypothetical protein